MSDRIKDKNKPGNPNTNDYSARFDKISNDFKKGSSAGSSRQVAPTPPSQGKPSGGQSTKASRKKKKRYRINFKRLFLTLLCVFLLAGIAGAVYVFSIVKDAEEINPDNIYDRLSESSILYDQDGQVLENLYNSPDGKRTNIAYSDIPENLRNAFIAVEDKTFWEHSGFNFVRIAGAVRDSLFGGGRISGTSTITQQLARNIYLSETRSSYSIKRKILEAYYTRVLEKHLTKQQILEAYLNTISLGFGSSGVQAASQAYFSKDVGDLTLTECVALAAIPQSPSNYALVKTLPNENVTEGEESIIHRGNTYTYLYNGDVSKDRRNLILKFMKDQNLIDSATYTAAVADDLRAYVNPYMGETTEASSYFVDYVTQQVLNDLMDNGYDSENAKYLLYNGGLRIHTTLNSNMQSIVEKEFSDNSNFPNVTNLKKDNAGNILGANGNILLYNYSNYFDESGIFTLRPDEYKSLTDGSLLIYAGNRLNFYKTEVQGKVDYSVEFKNMYQTIDNTFYSIEGGFISIPQEFKDKDKDGNLIIDAEFFQENPGFFDSSASGLSISNKNYALKQAVVQPQSAMTITDFKTGHIQAMAGGRNTVGRLLFNRADSPRQPGSSIKPMAVYAPALQSGLDTLNGGSTQDFSSVTKSMLGNYLTAASVIDDAPMVVQGKVWPKNWYSGYRGLYTLRASVEQSVNVNAVKVFMAIGADYSHKFLQKLGVTTVVEKGEVNDMNAAALALGGMTYGVSPLQMAGGYGAFANQGVYVEPIAYTIITNKRGETILEKVPRTNEVMDKGVAFIMTDILRTTVTSGIAGNAAIGIQPVAGKTGTTTDNYDAWFVGLTPQYAASLWIGNDINIELNQGSPAAAKLWSKIMKQACAGLSVGSFAPAPSNVISVMIDTKSGLLPSDISALDPRGTVRSEYFINGTQPSTTDNVHTYVSICTETGYLATPLCTYRQTAFGVQRPYTPDYSVGDIQYEVPHTYCPLHNPDPYSYPVNPNSQGNYHWEGQNITQDPPDDGTQTPGGGEQQQDDPNYDPNWEDPPIIDTTPPEAIDDMPDWLRP